MRAATPSSLLDLRRGRSSNRILASWKPTIRFTAMGVVQEQVALRLFPKGRDELMTKRPEAVLLRHHLARRTALRDAVSMRSRRLTPELECENDLGGRFTIAPVGIHTECFVPIGECTSDRCVCMRREAVTRCARTLPYVVGGLAVTARTQQGPLRLDGLERARSRTPDGGKSSWSRWLPAQRRSD